VREATLLRFSVPPRRGGKRPRLADLQILNIESSPSPRRGEGDETPSAGTGGSREGSARRFLKLRLLIVEGRPY